MKRSIKLTKQEKEIENALIAGKLVDIEKELKHYKDQFQGKVVYCNCDDPFESHFFTPDGHVAIGNGYLGR